ncbi:hypothetical protein [Streptomyces sp. NPDC101165]|uniref:hypothetical protein n=1 Tax=Streptomyces sp. NPDC101165 TaxID=3366119 RepID=UPI0037F2F9E2
MGLCLFPDVDDIDSPDISWSYSGFAAFRRRLAEAEGVDLTEMWGFGGERPWSDVSTTLEPLLDHPDDAGELSPAECAAILPRLEEVIDEWLSEGDAATLSRHIEDARQLVVVLRLCVEKGAAVLFG